MNDSEHKTFVCDYRHDDNAYSFDVLAVDWEEAERRLRSIKGNATVKGEIVARIPVGPLPPQCAPWLFRVWQSWRWFIGAPYSAK